jgi:hypothetical protein
MTPRSEAVPTHLPHVVATGFTTALLGDERTLREFVIGDHVARMLRGQGVNAVLYLVNDSYDPLNERQLRVGVEKDERRMAQFAQFCGRPIAEIPDPYECHASYSDHFLDALLDRLYGLDIHPMVLDAHPAYQQGHYGSFVSMTLHRYREMQEGITASCHDYTPRQLYRAQCMRCRCIDATELVTVSSDRLSYRCARCDAEHEQRFEELSGKLSWKIDCAARWNLYHIETEVFAKAHWSERGTLEVARAVSERFFGGQVPEIVRYGDVRLSRELSGKLLGMIPPPMLRRLLTQHPTRDLELTPESIEHFAKTYEVRPGLSYADYVRRVLPGRALEVLSANSSNGGPPRRPQLSESELVTYGNHFSEHFYGKRHELRLPEADVFPDTPSETIELARELIERALSLRGAEPRSASEIKESLKAFLAARPDAPSVYPFLRRLFHQDHGPNITTLLTIFPRDYLRAVHGIVAAHARVAEGASLENDARPRSAA